MHNSEKRYKWGLSYDDKEVKVFEYAHTKKEIKDIIKEIKEEYKEDGYYPPKMVIIEYDV
tara:strand:- start:559 stop:738 length:180 start_codon:yes stop_codon:yes gene_type:complete